MNEAVSRVIASAAAVVATAFAVLAAEPKLAHAQGSTAGKPPQRIQHPDFVGAQVCGQCHAAELKAWTGSHHQLAMLEATSESVLGDFSGRASLTTESSWHFFKRDGKFVVQTDGPDGKLDGLSRSPTPSV